MAQNRSSLSLSCYYFIKKGLRFAQTLLAKGLTRLVLYTYVNLYVNKDIYIYKYIYICRYIYTSFFLETLQTNQF